MLRTLCWESNTVNGAEPAQRIFCDYHRDTHQYTEVGRGKEQLFRQMHFRGNFTLDVIRTATGINANLGHIVEGRALAEALVSSNSTSGPGARVQETGESAVGNKVKPLFRSRLGLPKGGESKKAENGSELHFDRR